MRGNTKTTTLSVLALAFVALLIAPFAVAASSGLPPTITIEPSEADPGAAIEVIGLDFPGRAVVELELGSSAGPMALGAATTDESGYFREAVTLPAELAPGTWEVRAVAPDGSAASGTFRAGTMAAPEAPAPAIAENETVTRSGNSGTDIVFMIVIAFLIAGVGGGTALAWHLVREDSFQPGMSAGDDPIWSGGEADEQETALMAGDDNIWSAAHSD
jgi:hypothetical protein